MCVAHLSWSSHTCVWSSTWKYLYSLSRRFCWKLKASEQKCLPIFFFLFILKRRRRSFFFRSIIAKRKIVLKKNVMFKVSNIKCAYSTLYYGTAIIATSGSCVYLLATVHYSFYPTTNMPLFRLHDLNHSLSLFFRFQREFLKT